MLGKVRIIGTIVYVLMLFMSLFFFLERTAFVDIAYHLFHIIKDSDFAIQNYRFVAFFTQLFPLVSSKLGLDLEMIMKLYSASFVILYFMVFLLLLKLKEWKYALGLLLLNTLMVSHTFYWIQSELQQGLSMLILYFGLFSYSLRHKASTSPKSYLRYVLTILLFTVTFAHPLLLFPFMFLTLFFILSDSSKLKPYAYSFLGFIVFYLIKLLLFKTPYDSGAMGGVGNIVSKFPNYINLTSNYNFVSYLIHDYHFLLIGFIILAVYYIRNGQYFKIGLVALFCLGYTFLVNISYPDGADQFYIENLYLPLSIFIGFPLAFDVTNIKKSNLIIPALAIFLVCRLINIYTTHDIYTERVEYLQEIITEANQSNQTKRIIQFDEEMKSKLFMSWGTSFEIWLISTIHNKETSSIIITEDPQRLEWNIPYNQRFITNWECFEYSDLPEEYFIFKDTSPFKTMYNHK